MMTDINQYRQYPRANSQLSEFTQQISISLNKHKTEEIRVNEYPYSVNKAGAEMSLKDQRTFFQKLANAEYLQKVAALRRRSGFELRGKRPAPKVTGQHEAVHVDRERIKHRKLEAPHDQKKTCEFLIAKELAELEVIALEIEKQKDDAQLIEYFNLLIKRNGGLIGVESRTEVLTSIDMKLLNLILNKFKTRMYILISHWVYQEYNLYLTTSINIYKSRYETILSEFSTALENKSSEELVKSMEEWYNYVWCLPLLTEGVFQNIYSMCIKEDAKNGNEPSFSVPLRLLMDLIMSPGHKEEVRQKALKKLLKLSTYPKGVIKIKAIKILSPELYSDPTCKEPIGTFALESFEKLKEFKGTEDENAVISQIGLLLRLSADDPEILLSGIKKFPLVNPAVKGLVLVQYKKMFEKCWNPSREELKEVFEEVSGPSAQIVQTYVEAYKSTSFPGPLKKTLITLAKNLSNYQLLQPLIPQISQIEIDSNNLIESAAIAECSGKLEFIFGLIQNMSKSINYCEKFRKILTQLHEFDLSIGKNVVEVIDMCIEKKDLFELNDIVLPTLIELAKRDKVPVLLPRTILKVSLVYPKKVVACLKIIKILLEKEVWKSNELGYGISQFLKKFGPIVKANIDIFSGESGNWVRRTLGLM